MSGPLASEDLDEGPAEPLARELEVTESRTATVGRTTVRRALPHRGRRTVGAWCFVDHMGPTMVSDPTAAGIGPHPHMGLQTVTWLLAGELRHRDSLGSDQVIRPGQLNLMTAGHGVAHAEEGHDYRGPMQGVQLWVAQPERTRHGPPAFEHHAELPQVELGPGVGTVLVGSFAGVSSPARRDTDHVGVDLRFGAGRTGLPLVPSSEHALVVLEGEVTVDGTVALPGHLVYLGTGRDELGCEAEATARGLLLGGAPFESPVSMWWNFVAREHAEMTDAARTWNDRGDRFGEVASTLERIPAPPPPWPT
jgi:redox-sensitive bicupin YhaK (pirin superfamily)